MILILSNALAKRWKLKPIPLANCPSFHPALIWRADWFLVGRSRSNILCVNEESLFSFALIDQKQMPFKRTMLRMINRVGDSLYQAGVPGHLIRQGFSDNLIAKHADRRVIGTMTDQKLQYEWDILTPHPDVRGLADVERRVNNCPFTILDMKYPSKAFAETVKRPWA
jgi:hypothetical protein